MKSKHTSPNTIRLEFKNENTNVTRKMVIESVVKQLKIPTNMIEFVCTPLNKNSWVVAFKAEIDCKNLFGCNIIVGDESIKIEDYNSIPQKFKIKYETYKILWLYHRQDLMSIQKFIMQLLNVKNDDIRIVKCYEEIYNDLDDLRESDDDGTLIKTGNIIFTISYKDDLIVNEIKGIQKYNGKRINIIKYGDSPKCFGCKEEGHQKKDCPHKDTICENCSKKGHPKCTYASRLRNDNYDEEEGTCPENSEDYQFENEPSNTNSAANTNSEANNNKEKNSSNEANGAEQNMSTSQESSESTSSNEEDLNESKSGKNEADTSISASQLNTISDIQRTVTNANDSMVVLGNPDRFKRGADTSLSSITSTSPSKDDAKMEVGVENEKKNGNSEMKKSTKEISKKSKKTKTLKPN
jgi:hypothetical protein